MGAMGLGGRVGAQITLKGDFELHARKIDDHLVELDVTPTKIRGIQVMGGAILVDGSAGRVSAESFGQKFSFDLSTEGGRAAYQAAIRGELPGGLSSKDISAKEAFAQGDLRQDDLPPGVTRLRMEKVEVKEKQIGGKVGWMFLSAGRTRTRRVSDHLVTDGLNSVNTHSRMVDKKRRTILSGNESQGVTGSMRVTSAMDPKTGEMGSRFDGLELRAHWTDDKVKGRELNKDIVADMNEALGFSLKKFTVKGKKESRQVHATATLMGADLLALKVASPRQIEKVARSLDTSPSRLKKLVASLKGAPNDVVAARTVQAFVQMHGAQGMGQVLHLAGAAEKLAINTASSAYDTPAAEAEKLVARHQDADWSGAMSKKEISGRYKGVVKTREALAHGLALAADDPLLEKLPEEKAQIEKNLAEKDAALAPLVDFSALSHENAIAMAQKLDRGWTSRVQEGARDAIIEEAGLKGVDFGFFTTRAKGEKQLDDGAVAKTLSTTDHRFITLLGDERQEVSARARLVGKNGESLADALVLKATLVDEQSRGKEINAEAVADINQAFGLGLKGIEVGDKGWKGAQRSISATVDLDRAALVKLGQVDPAGVEPQLRKLAEKLKGNSPEAIIDVLQVHVQNKGLSGMGEVAKLSGHPPAITSSTDAYDKAVNEAGKIADGHATAIGAKSKNKELSKRFGEVKKANALIESAFERMAGDHLIDGDAKNEAAEKLVAVRQRLESALNCTHLSVEDAATLIANLDSGWTTQNEQAALKRIKADAGIFEVHRDLSGDLVTSAVRGSGDEKITSWTRTEISKIASGDEKLFISAERQASKGHALQLSATFTDSVEKDGELSGEIAGRINKAFGTDFSTQKTRGDKSARSVAVNLQLNADDLDALAGFSQRKISQAAKQAGLGTEAALSLKSDLKRLQGDSRPHALQRFVAENGLEALGFLHRTLSPESPLDVKTESAGYGNALKNAEEALAIYGDVPLRKDMTKAELVGRLKTLDRADRLLKDARARVSADPLLDSKSRADLLAQLQSTQSGVKDALSFSVLSKNDRQALAARLDSGWTSLFDRSLIQRIQKGA
jgi:hypothetical protein